MALTIYQTIEPDGNFPAVKAADVEMPDGTRLGDLDLGSLNVISYDLAEMGVPALVVDGDPLQLETDTEEISNATANNIVTLNLDISMGGLVFNDIKATFAPNGNVATVSILTSIVFVSVFITDGKLILIATLKDKKEAAASSINLSAFETEGKIVETYADGSTATTVMEFNDDGKPVKITDGNGNVTDLIW